MRTTARDGALFGFYILISLKSLRVMTEFPRLTYVAPREWRHKRGAPLAVLGSLARIGMHRYTCFNNWSRVARYGAMVTI